MSKSCAALKRLFFVSIFCLAASALQASDPVFVADLANPNDFSIFANGGWDGNWYVGYNNCWMQKLKVPAGEYSRAFVGAKLGRMKNFTPPGKAPWEKKAYEGEMMMAVSSTPSWAKSQSFTLTGTQDIPLEPDFENAVEGVGESRWFWKEIPVKLVEPGKDVFLAIWSPTKDLNSISSAPILAAGWGNQDVNSWLSSDGKGSPPSNPEKALSTPVTVFEPALALKLIPVCSSGTQKSPSMDACPGAPEVKITEITNGKPRPKEPTPKVLKVSARGEAVERAWIEISQNKKDWVRYGRFVWSAPFAFTVRMQDAAVSPDGKIWARAAAQDVFENVGVSEPVNLINP